MEKGKGREHESYRQQGSLIKYGNTNRSEHNETHAKDSIPEELLWMPTFDMSHFMESYESENGFVPCDLFKGRHTDVCRDGIVIFNVGTVASLMIKGHFPLTWLESHFTPSFMDHLHRSLLTYYWRCRFHSQCSEDETPQEREFLRATSNSRCSEPDIRWFIRSKLLFFQGGNHL